MRRSRDRGGGGGDRRGGGGNRDGDGAEEGWDGDRDRRGWEITVRWNRGRDRVGMRSLRDKVDVQIELVLLYGPFM